MADIDLQRDLVGELLQLDLPQPQPVPVGAATVGVDLQAGRVRAAAVSEMLPPAMDRVDRELGGVVIDTPPRPKPHHGEHLVRFADRALYWAKEGGRNTTFMYTQEAHALLSRETRSFERFQAMSSVRALARAIDSKDASTRQHSERVASLAERLALAQGWTAKRASLLHASGLLHDVGKIAIPDEILRKPGPLTDAECYQVKRHAEMGAYIAAEVLEAEQVAWVRGHHERWDGTGYPDRIAAEQIPDGAQLLALADAWDVMTQSRTYKPTKAPMERSPNAWPRRATSSPPAPSTRCSPSRLRPLGRADLNSDRIDSWPCPPQLREAAKSRSGAARAVLSSCRSASSTTSPRVCLAPHRLLASCLTRSITQT